MTTVIETARLRLRTWEEGDGAAFHAACNTPAVMRWLGPLLTTEQSDAVVARMQAMQAAHGHCFWVVERAADGRFLGFCGMKRVDAPGTDLTGQAEIGWRLREDAWGQGYAREAAAAALDFAFAELREPHVVAFTVAGNRASWGLMARLGMTRRPDLDYEDPRFAGELSSTIVYRIGADQWTS